MTDFELRIGPKKSLTPEPRPVFAHKTWTRPGYIPPTVPRGPRLTSRSDDTTARPHPHSDGEPALLLRMHLASPYPSKSGSTNTASRRFSGKLFSERIAPETTGDISAGTLTLGNHRVGPLLGHEAATRQVSPFQGGSTNGGISDYTDISTPHGQKKCVLVCHTLDSTILRALIYSVIPLSL